MSRPPALKRGGALGRLTPPRGERRGYRCELAAVRVVCVGGALGRSLPGCGSARVRVFPRSAAHGYRRSGGGWRWCGGAGFALVRSRCLQPV
jgi:hypothetical protein|tara:strand:- start:505 stop:780 length:276 start_codon:yes stop_codon:yes gene_type:complete